MRNFRPKSAWILLLLVGIFAGHATEVIPRPKGTPEPKPPQEPPPLKKYGPPNVTIAQLIPGNPMARNYPYGLVTLLQAINERTTIKVDTNPVLIQSFEDENIFKYPFIYVNFADRTDWTFTPLEQRNLKAYIERGGFIFVDAGINSEFLRGNAMFGQHHSFADWEATPELRDAFKTVFPEKQFAPLPRDHEIFKSFYQGLPEADKLPDSVRDFVLKEKWPQGTYSTVALKYKGRLAVIATPIIAMGWGKNSLGNWHTYIRFRIREGAKDLDSYLETAAYSGKRYEANREDGLKDIIYCQKAALPAWVQEPGERWRVFRYYHSQEISDFAHHFYTRLGINFVVYALTH